jgi:hypothetical protein
MPMAPSPGDPDLARLSERTIKATKHPVTTSELRALPGVLGPPRGRAGGDRLPGTEGQALGWLQAGWG